MTDFLTADTSLPSYMMFPRFLLDMEINETAKMLYMILLDRAIRGSKEPRSPYGTFQNVFLSETELENIRQTIPDWQDYMERLSGYMASTGKQYQNHAATIIRWARQDHPVSRQRNYESEEYETL